MNRSRALLAIMLALSFGAAGQDKPNFSGKWELDTGKSDFGSLAAPDAQTHVIEHKGVNIKLTQTIRGDAVLGGGARTERYYTTDGKPTLNKLGPSDANSTTKWDGHTLVIETKLETPEGTLMVTDSWALESHGKQMVVSKQFKNSEGVGRQKLLFQKQ